MLSEFQKPDKEQEMPTWEDIKYTTLIVVLVGLPVVAVSLGLPLWWSDWKLTGNALWALERRGMPSAVVDQLLPLRLEDYASHEEVMAAARGVLSPEEFSTHAPRISRQVVRQTRPGVVWVFMGILTLWYGLVFVGWRRWGYFWEGASSGASGASGGSSGSSS